MKTPGRRLYGTLDRAAERKGIKKALGRIVRGTSHAVIAGGTAVMVIGMFGLSLELTLIGVSLLVPGVFFRTMMGTTKDISERLFEGQDRIETKLDEVLVAIRGPPKKDKDGKSIKPDYANDNLLAKMDELNTNMTAKLDRLIEAVERMADRRP